VAGSASGVERTNTAKMVPSINDSFSEEMLSKICSTFQLIVCYHCLHQFVYITSEVLKGVRNLCCSEAAAA